MPDAAARFRSSVRFRALLNDLKRTEEDAARELATDIEIIRDILEGRLSPPTRLINRATRIWPVNRRDFYPIENDTVDGALIMSRRGSACTSRTVVRSGKPYYEYQDLAMTRTTGIRPEWIRMLHTVEDNDADNPTIEWNLGHYLFQFTYFVGDVNYYYEWQGRRFCRPMQSGDSVIGLPYSPHSFANRAGGQPGLILALTFAGRIGGDRQEQIALLTADSLSKLALSDAADRQLSVSERLILAQAADIEMPLEVLESTSGVGPLHRATANDVCPTYDELARLAAALRTPISDFVVAESDLSDGVRFGAREGSRNWYVPHPHDFEYCVRELAYSVLVPYVRGLELEFHKLPSKFSCSRLNTFVFNLGPGALQAEWLGDHSHAETLDTGGSATILPFVAHRFSPVDVPSSVLMLRCSPDLTGEVQKEAFFIGEASLKRMQDDICRWY